MYFYYQATPTSSWEVGLASERAKVIAEKNPELVTVLDVDNAFTEDLNLDEVLAVKYLGPYYIDFDGGNEDLDTVIAQFKTFLNKLIEKGVSLDMIRLYASGGRGFHIEIPLQLMLAKVPPQGIACLPYIFKEMSYEMYVDTLDMRVYSAKRGRMWRLPNFKRASGKYKVQITRSEALEMTPEMYDRVCSAPRAPLPSEPPAFNSGLGLMFSLARDKIEQGAKKAKAKKKTKHSLERFKGEWPKPLQAVVKTGEGVKDGVGWNRIALQMSLTAQALGRSEDQLVEDLQPLIETYHGDSSRYGSHRKRETHLREMYRYMEGNVTYDFDPQALGSIFDKSVRLDSLECDGYDPEEDQNEGEDEDEDAGEDAGEAGDEHVIPVRVSSQGIWVRSEEGWKRGSLLGLKNPRRLVNEDNQDEGYEVEVFVEGRSKGTVMMPMQTLTSRSQLHNFALTWSTSVSINDAQVGEIANILRRRTDKMKRVTYVTHREGIDLFTIPGEEQGRAIWVSPTKVVTGDDNVSVRLRSKLTKTGKYKSDLMDAPDLTNSPEDVELVHHLLNLNAPVNVARILGWFVACFLCQPIRFVNNNKFPLLQVYGEAGAGKSHTTNYFNQLHYYKAPPVETMSVGGTNYPAIAACASSASMPVVFEEMKPSEMSKQRKDFLVSLFRSAYDGHANERGGLSRDSGPREVVISENELKGPVMFVGESLEDQSAIVERCVIVALSKAHRQGRKASDDYLKEHRQELGKIGKAIALAALSVDLDNLRKQLADTEKMLLNEVKDEEMSRPVTALSVTLVGLEFMRMVLKPIMGGQFDEKFYELRSAITANVTNLMPSNKPEIVKVLDVLAQLTRHQNVMMKLEEDVDYAVTDDGTEVELNLKQCFYKFVQYERSIGRDPMFGTDAKFIAAMNGFAGTARRACPNSPLFKGPRQVIYSVSLEYLTKYDVEHFGEFE